MKHVAWGALNILQALFVSLWSVIWITLSLLSLIVTFRPNIAFWIAREPWSRGLLWCSGAKIVEIRGGDGIDFTKPHIFVLNHQSMADIPVGFRALPVPLRFVAKKALAHVPFLGWYMWAVGMVFVDRARSVKAIQSLEAAGARIREGANIIAFPEGTRSRDGRVQPFKKGIFMVALKAGVPIVPMAIEGTLTVLPAGGFRPRPNDVRVNIGEPIETTGYTRETLVDLMREVRTQVIELHREIGGQGGDLSTVTPAAANENRAREHVPA